MTVRTRVQPLDAAIASGAIADFGEKYGETVRIVTIGDGVSMRQVAEDVQIKAGIATFNEASHFVNLLHAGELCGGTHVKNTADMFAFHIVRESGIGAGTRRVEALASEAACVSCYCVCASYCVYCRVSRIPDN
jgi:alanyl-tRNA synthetase